MGADVHAIAEKLIHFMVAHEHYCERNYRGIEGLFANQVVGPILKQLPEPRPYVPPPPYASGFLLFTRCAPGPMRVEMCG